MSKTTGYISVRIVLSISLAQSTFGKESNSKNYTAYYVHSNLKTQKTFRTGVPMFDSTRKYETNPTRVFSG